MGTSPIPESYRIVGCCGSCRHMSFLSVGQMHCIVDGKSYPEELRENYKARIKFRQDRKVAPSGRCDEHKSA